jgi:hypothetical protein
MAQLKIYTMEYEFALLCDAIHRLQYVHRDIVPSHKCKMYKVSFSHSHFTGNWQKCCSTFYTGGGKKLKD